MSEDTTTNIDVATELRLNCDAIDCKPITIDWREAIGENLEGWRSYECSECPECKRMVVSSSYGECEHRDIESEVTITDEDGNEEDVDNECTATIYNEGPQMNYWYPVKIDDCEEAARLIAHFPLCVVEFEDGETGLALTGGGMDLSWEICGAFLALGYYPPVHFCDLPEMSTLPANARVIIEACVQSCEIAAGWALRKAERIKELAVKRDGALFDGTAR